MNHKFNLTSAIDTPNTTPWLIPSPLTLYSSLAPPVTRFYHYYHMTLTLDRYSRLAAYCWDRWRGLGLRTPTAVRDVLCAHAPLNHPQPPLTTTLHRTCVRVLHRPNNYSCWNALFSLGLISGFVLRAI